MARSREEFVVYGEMSTPVGRTLQLTIPTFFNGVRNTSHRDIVSNCKGYKKPYTLTQSHIAEPAYWGNLLLTPSKASVLTHSEWVRYADDLFGKDVKAIVKINPYRFRANGVVRTGTTLKLVHLEMVE